MPPLSSAPRCIACVVLPSISPFGASLDTAILSYPPVQETGTIIYIDCVSRGNSMFILKKENFHHIFHFLEEIHKLAKQTLRHIKIRVPIANFDQFADACERDTRKLRKLKNIATQSYLDNVSMDDIKR